MQGSWISLCLLLAGSATAAEQEAHSCTSIADAMTRLACYDAAFGATAAKPPQPVTPNAASAAPPATPPVAPAVAPPPVAKTPEAAFGDTGNLRGTQKPVLPKRLVATVVNAVSVGRGLYRLTLDNGQVWQTLQADWALDFNSRDNITISRMMLGNYLISHTGQGLSVSIKRIQ
jgi:hypothetical protein